MEEHYQAFLRDSQDSELFGADDRLQAENSYSKATQHYDNLLRSVEQGRWQVRVAGLFRCIEKPSITFTVHQVKEIAHRQSHLGPRNNPVLRRSPEHGCILFCMLDATVC